MTDINTRGATPDAGEREDRLRAALERIEKIYYGDEFSEVWEAALEMAHVAREALEPTDNT